MRNPLFGVVITILSFACNSAKEVRMPFYNYYIQASRLVPLQFSDSKLNIRIWISQSTSLDRVISINKDIDSTFSGTLTTFGYKIKRKKPIYEFKVEKIDPVSGHINFLQKLLSLKIDSFKNQELSDLVLHQPYKYCIVEILENKKYNSFIFQLDANKDVEKFENLRKLFASEFPQINFEK